VRLRQPRWIASARPCITANLGRLSFFVGRIFCYVGTVIVYGRMDESVSDNPSKPALLLEEELLAMWG